LQIQIFSKTFHKKCKKIILKRSCIIKIKCQYIDDPLNQEIRHANCLFNYNNILNTLSINSAEEAKRGQSTRQIKYLTVDKQKVDMTHQNPHN
jgi:hypothetical protein